MAKKARSAKQRANDRRLGRMAKARHAAKRKSPAKRITRKSPKRVIRHVRKRSSMAKRRAAPRRSRGLSSKIPLVNNPTFKKAAAGVGMATLGATALSLVAPKIAANPIVKPALALLGGEVVGLAAQLFTGGGLSGIFGGGNGGVTSGAGFA